MSTLEPKPLDLERWPSVEAALEELGPRSRDYEQTVVPYVQRFVAATGGVDEFGMFVMSAVARARGLHEGIVHGIGRANPHATYPLMRSLLETAALVFYASDNRTYVRSLSHDPRDRRQDVPKRKSPQALINYMDRNGHTDFLGKLYGQLCDMTHFGHVAMWAAWEIDDYDERAVSWTTVPRFRGDTALGACGHLEEMTELMVMAAGRVGQTLLGTGSMEPLP